MKIDTAIHKVINSPEVKAIVKNLRKEYRWWSWTRGGCFAFAEALIAAFPNAKLWVLAERMIDDWASHHAFVKYHGKFYDATGCITKRKIIKYCDKFQIQRCNLKIGEVENWPDELPVWYPDQEFVTSKEIELITKMLR